MDTTTLGRVILVTAVCVYTKVQGTIHTVCTNTDTDTAVIPLNCSTNQRIHVISELYGRRTSEDNCTVVRDDSAKLFETDSNGLIVDCNGHVSCKEQTSCGVHCNGSGHAFEITYTCAEESKDICSPLHEKGIFPSLYLHSPGFLNKTDVEEGICECSVSGGDLQVTLVEKGIKDVLQLDTSGANNTTWKHRPADTFNKWIASKAENITISFIAGQQARLLVNIAGSIAEVTCNKKSSQTTLTSRNPKTITTTLKSRTITQTTTTQQTPTASTQRESVTQSKESRTTTMNPSSSTMSENMRSKEKLYETTTEAHKTDIESLTVMTVSVGSLVINFLLFAIIIVFFNFIKQRLRKNGRAETVGTSDDYARGSNEPINTYCDLAEYQNADEGYRKVHVYADSKF